MQVHRVMRYWWKNLNITDRGRHEWRAMDFTKDFAGWRRGRSSPIGPWHAVRSSPEYGLLFSTSLHCALGRLRMDGWQQRGHFRASRGSAASRASSVKWTAVPRRAAWLYKPTVEAGCIPRPAKGGPTISRAPTATKSTVDDLVAVIQRPAGCSVTRRWAPKGTLPFSCTVRKTLIWCSRTRRCWSKRRPGRLEGINRPLAAKLCSTINSG